MEARRDAAAVASSAETVERLVENLARVVHAPEDTLRLIVLALVAERLAQAEGRWKPLRAAAIAS